MHNRLTFRGVDLAKLSQSHMQLLNNVGEQSGSRVSCESDEAGLKSRVTRSRLSTVSTTATTAVSATAVDTPDDTTVAADNNAAVNEASVLDKHKPDNHNSTSNYDFYAQVTHLFILIGVSDLDRHFVNVLISAPKLQYIVFRTAPRDAHSDTGYTLPETDYQSGNTTNVNEVEFPLSVHTLLTTYNFHKIPVSLTLQLAGGSKQGSKLCAIYHRKVKDFTVVATVGEMSIDNVCHLQDNNTMYCDDNTNNNCTNSNTYGSIVSNSHNNIDDIYVTPVSSPMRNRLQLKLRNNTHRKIVHINDENHNWQR